MKKILFLLSILFFAFISEGQSYRTAVGLRFGTEWGISLQQRIFKHVTIEGIVQQSLIRSENQTLLTLLLEHHKSIISKRFNIYYGAGLHTGVERFDDKVSEGLFGLSTILGLEFTLGEINVSYDIKPGINIRGGRIFNWDSSLSVRYVIWKQPKRKLFKKRKKKKRKDDDKWWNKLLKPKE